MESNFDYVIVGAGPAGCILAARLSENPGVRVALLEAGGRDRSPWLRVPIGFANLYYNKRYNWMYRSVAQPALGGREIYCPRGKVVGGSGAINAMIYVRGAPADFDSWAAEGNAGWRYDDILPYFKKLEDHEGGADAYHGSGGAIAVRSLRPQAHPLCGSFIAASQELGLPQNHDFNGAKLEGAGYYDVNVREGVRSSANFEYLRPALRRPNLALIPNALVSRIVISGARATGVEFLRGGQAVTLTARCEVVLCAGAVDTPKLLQLSGVGDAAVLAGHGIETKKHLPAVGSQLQDHICASYYYRANQRTMNDDFRSKLHLARFALDYALRRRGPFAMSVNHAGGFFSTAEGRAVANMQLYFNALSYRIPQKGRAKLVPEPYSGFLLAYNSCRPTSRGSVTLASADIHDAALIDPNYLSTEADCADAIAGGRLVRRLLQTKALRAVTEAEISPGPDAETGEELLSYFRENSGSIYHLCGTARMGPDARSSVVDSQLRVHGLERLRVVDASIFPSITSANTHASVLMVAEKAAAMIAQERR